MSFWKTISYRWDKAELEKWPSLKKTAYLLLPLLIYFAVHDIAEFSLWMLLKVFIAGDNEEIISFLNQNGQTVQGILYSVAILIGVAVIWPAVKGEIWGGAKPQKNTEPLKDGNTGKWLEIERFSAYWGLAMIAFCLAMSLNIFFAQTGFTGSSETYDRIYQMQYGVQFGAGLILYGIISPLAEEAVFRGLLYNRMKRCFHYGIALVVSSLLFGFYHGNPVQAVYGSILGILIAYFYDQYESFAAPVLFHAVANISVYTMTYRNELACMDRTIALIEGAVFFTVAVLIFIYIKKKFLSSL